TETGAGAVDEDGARTLLELAAALGAPLSAEDKRYLVAHPARTLAPDEPYDDVLDDGLLVPDAEPLPQLARLPMPAGPPPAPAPVEPASRAAAVRICAQLARVVGAPAVGLYAARAPGAPDVTVHAVTPPALVLGPRLLAIEEPDPVVDAELRFL